MSLDRRSRSFSFSRAMPGRTCSFFSFSTLLCCVHAEQQPLQRLLVCPKQPRSISPRLSPVSSPALSSENLSSRGNGTASRCSTKRLLTREMIGTWADERETRTKKEKKNMSFRKREVQRKSPSNLVARRCKKKKGTRRVMRYLDCKFKA